MAVTSPDLVRELEELIEALDRRAPQGGRAEEASIAREAARLRQRAVKRLEEIGIGSASRDVSRTHER
jgi:uncharacterized protein (DUF58 family)